MPLRGLALQDPSRRETINHAYAPHALCLLRSAPRTVDVNCHTAKKRDEDSRCLIWPAPRLRTGHRIDIKEQRWGRGEPCLPSSISFLLFLHFSSPTIPPIYTLTLHLFSVCFPLPSFITNITLSILFSFYTTFFFFFLKLFLFFICHVRFGSKADICSAKRHVRFTPKSGHRRSFTPAARPFGAHHCI